MGDTTLMSIGELAESSGLPVKVIRHWSDVGIVPPARRSDAGFRLYDPSAVLQLRLARTLRELGLGLAAIRAVITRERSLAEVTALHADAIEAQIRLLRRQQAVLRSVGGREADADELAAAVKAAGMSAEERDAIVQELVESALSGLDLPVYREGLLAAVPELPDEPSQEQINAWIELADLIRDPDLRAAMRRLADYHAAHGSRDYDERDTEQIQRVADLWVERVNAAMADGIPADSPQADQIIADIVAAWLPTQARGANQERAGLIVDTDGEQARTRLLQQLQAAAEPLVERYWQLICVINGWPVPPSLQAVGQWLVTALRANPAPGARSDRISAILNAEREPPAGVLDHCAQVLTEVGQIVAAVTPVQLDKPTPCTAWNVKTLLNHLVYENLMWTSLANGTPRSDHDADHLGGDHVAAFHNAAEETLAAFRRPGMLQEQYGPAPGWRLVQQVTIEMLIHGWDLATATGQPAELAPTVADELLPAVQEIYGDLPRTPGGSIGPQQPAPVDATAADRLAAYLGRTVERAQDRGQRAASP